MNLDEIKQELGDFFRVHSEEVKAMVYENPELDPYVRTITRVKGQFPAIHSVTSHVVQQFQAVWTELGETKFVPNVLKAFHQKVNFPIVPAEILNSYLAFLYQENVRKEDMPISRWIAEQELRPKAQEDVAQLSITGEYDASKPTEFGFSMDGVVKILDRGIADGSMYKILLNTITDSNIVDVVTAFEKAIPPKVQSSIGAIFMSKENADRYKLKYEDTFGANTNFNERKQMLSRLNSLPIVGLRWMNGSDHIFATPRGNFLKLIDIFDAPTVNDVQVLDYKVKIFMEFWLGYGFWINQMVCVSDYSGDVEGLGSYSGNDEQALYYA